MIVRCFHRRLLYPPSWKSSFILMIGRYKHYGKPTSWSKYFETLEKNIFTNRISQQRPSNMKFIQYENIFAYHVIKLSIPFADHDHNNDISTFKCDLNRFFSSDENGVDDINAKILALNIEQIINLMKSLYHNLPVFTKEDEWNKAFLDSPFSRIWQHLDSLLTNRIEQDWSANKSKYMLISSLWFELGLGQNVCFNKSLMKKLLAEQQLDKSMVLYLMFQANLARNSITALQRRTMIEKIHLFLNENNELTVDELSLIGVGFFKTQTRMPLELLRSYIESCTEQLLQFYPIRSTISIVSILKIIRFSLETIEFNRQKLRTQLNRFVEILGNHPSNFFDSEICLTHLILMLNSILIIDRKLFRQIFARMMANLSIFRIKDIERILFCLANVRFQCPVGQLRRLEQYLCNNDESRLYPNCTYNILLSLFMMGYEPKQLLGRCVNQQQIQDSIASSKMILSTQLLTLDSIMRLRNRKPLLDEKQIEQFQSSLAYLFDNLHTQKGRFIQFIYESLRQQQCDGRNVQLMYLLPFITYPFPVILNKSNFISKLNDDRTFCPFVDSIPYRADYLKRKFFHGSYAILPLMEKDYTVGSSLRGTIHLNKSLLEDLGFRIIPVEHREFRQYFIHHDDDENNTIYSNAKIQSLSLLLFKVQKFIQSKKG
ncbi:uncharacterized protein LOC124493882 [Dermatophagoides farinae]|uniref:Mitochondrial RNA processing n=1 Tax=Dermatophagoides farinae TaxID=6954 RepID=A0A922HLZ6_DERFA|nr:hypothetical protein HUG17_6801 [Dermatophagoides farinae]KAH9493582.1 mitochondrial RNA processing [Dermatophagoides farinae]